MRILGHAPYLPSPAASSRQNNPESTPATQRVVGEAAALSGEPPLSSGTMLMPVASSASVPEGASLNQRKALQAYQSVQRLAQSSVEVMGLDARA